MPSHNTVDTIVVTMTFIISRGRSGAPRHPLTLSGSCTGLVPNGRTANNAVHQMMTNRTTPETQFIAVSNPDQVHVHHRPLAHPSSKRAA
jgi:hypothetical protein